MLKQNPHRVLCGSIIRLYTDYYYCSSEQKNHTSSFHYLRYFLIAVLMINGIKTLVGKRIVHQKIDERLPRDAVVESIANTLRKFIANLYAFL